MKGHFIRGHAEGYFQGVRMKDGRIFQHGDVAECLQVVFSLYPDSEIRDRDFMRGWGCYGTTTYHPDGSYLTVLDYPECPNVSGFWNQ